MRNVIPFVADRRALTLSVAAAVLLLSLAALALFRIQSAGVAPQAAPQRVERLSAAAERPARSLYQSYGPALSADGQLVAFWSTASDLVPGDSNGQNDIFIKDRQSGAIERVSVAADGGQANGPSLNAALSADGRFVAFESRATNLVARDTNSTNDVFVKDRQSGAIERVSVAADGGQANGASNRPALSADGRLVAFWSEASTLVEDDTNNTYDNGGYDIFVKDRQTGAIERVSVAPDGSEGIADSVAPSLSADGRFVAFGSYASNLVVDDNNAAPDIFVADRQRRAIERVSLAADGSEGDADSFWNPVLSADGRFVAFWSEASNLVPGDTNGVVDVFVKDRQSGALERASAAASGVQGNGPSYNPALSADGSYVVFWSEASTLIPGDSNGVPDVFVRDRSSGAIERVSVSSSGTQANGASYNPALSTDGLHVAFWSEASNLVADDSNGRADIFVVEQLTTPGR
jgi:Tol biopolymer transport system component